MKIIGHRGARGVELENSIASIEAAFKLDVDAIEFDIHRTSDDVFVVIHDATTGRVAEQDVRVRDVTYAELRAIRLKNGQQIPTLEEVLRIAGNRSLYIDIKDPDSAGPLLQLVDKHPTDITFVSRLANELQAIRDLRPDAPTYLYFLKAENLIPRPVHMVRAAKAIQATGIGLDKLIINPLTYSLARKNGLKVYSYSVGSRAVARLFARLYPGIDLCTSHPELLNRQFVSSQ
jgi:glycerophosphoryl diester phosphodiesterase